MLTSHLPHPSPLTPPHTHALTQTYTLTRAPTHTHAASRAWRCATASTRPRGAAARRPCCSRSLIARRSTACRWRARTRCRGARARMRACLRACVCVYLGGEGVAAEWWRVSVVSCAGKQAAWQATMLCRGARVRMRACRGGGGTRHVRRVYAWPLRVHGWCWCLRLSRAPHPRAGAWRPKGWGSHPPSPM